MKKVEGRRWRWKTRKREREREREREGGIKMIFFFLNIL